MAQLYTIFKHIRLENIGFRQQSETNVNSLHTNVLMQFTCALEGY